MVEKRKKDREVSKENMDKPIESNENQKFLESMKRIRKALVTLTDGSKYEGEWKGDVKDGVGTLVFADGARYEGNFANDKASGFGKIVHANGDVYEGEWQNEQAHGKGKYIG